MQGTGRSGIYQTMFLYHAGPHGKHCLSSDNTGGSQNHSKIKVLYYCFKLYTALNLHIDSSYCIPLNKTSFIIFLNKSDNLKTVCVIINFKQLICFHWHETWDSDTIIFYWLWLQYVSSVPQVDFLALEMRKGKVNFLWDVGSGVGRVEYPHHTIYDGNWYRIEASR